MITNEQIDNKINETIISISNTIVSAGEGTSNDELAIIVLKSHLMDICRWYNRRIIQGLESKINWVNEEFVQKYDADTHMNDLLYGIISDLRKIYD